MNLLSTLICLGVVVSVAIPQAADMQASALAPGEVSPETQSQEPQQPKSPEPKSPEPKSPEPHASVTDIKASDIEEPRMQSEQAPKTAASTNEFSAADVAPNSIPAGQDGQNEASVGKVKQIEPEKNNTPDLIEEESDSESDSDSEDLETPTSSGPACDPKALRAIHGKQLQELIRFYSTQSLKTKQEMILLYLRLVEKLVVRKLNKKMEYISSWDFDEFEKGRAKYIKQKVSRFLRSKTGSLLDKVSIPFSLSIRVLSVIADHIRSGKAINASSFSDESSLAELCANLTWCIEPETQNPTTLTTLRSFKMYSVFDKLFGKSTEPLSKRADSDPSAYSFYRMDVKYPESANELKRVFEETARSPEYLPIDLSKRDTPRAILKRRAQVKRNIGSGPEKSAPVKREDCVPVTWYNVFHHSIFGKPKFCHT